MVGHQPRGREPAEESLAVELGHRSWSNEVARRGNTRDGAKPVQQPRCGRDAFGVGYIVPPMSWEK